MSLAMKGVPIRSIGDDQYKRSNSTNGNGSAATRTVRVAATNGTSGTNGLPAAAAAAAESKSSDHHLRNRSLSPSRALLTPESAHTITEQQPIKRVFTFGKGKSEGNKGMKALLGGKGANLAEMATIGLSVPPGLTISTEACQEYQNVGKKLPEGLWEEIMDGLKIVESEMGAYLGDQSKPLLLSVRSGQLFLCLE